MNDFITRLEAAFPPARFTSNPDDYEIDYFDEPEDGLLTRLGGKLWSELPDESIWETKLFLLSNNALAIAFPAVMRAVVRSSYKNSRVPEMMLSDAHRVEQVLESYNSEQIDIVIEYLEMCCAKGDQFSCKTLTVCKTFNSKLQQCKQS